MGSLLSQQKRIERNKRYLFLGVEAAGVLMTFISPVLGIPIIAGGVYLGWQWFQFRVKNGMRF
ncbi:MAG: hypothetical protein KC505_10070 [Myxococcales bacterium]|nr:hypothetical protein [Myxococcales bacterium]USN49849.1 MAG: hypothetical protein H6731_06100 [Myxococcales bacterium]